MCLQKSSECYVVFKIARLAFACGCRQSALFALGTSRVSLGGARGQARVKVGAEVEGAGALPRELAHDDAGARRGERVWLPGDRGRRQEARRRLERHLQRSFAFLAGRAGELVSKLDALCVASITGMWLSQTTSLKEVPEVPDQCDKRHE